MKRNCAVPTGWHSMSDLALRFGCSTHQIEALVRRHHWPRVYQEYGALVGAELHVVAGAFGLPGETMAGQGPPQAAGSDPHPHGASRSATERIALLPPVGRGGRD
jgi:hypothetical protein